MYELHVRHILTSYINVKVIPDRLLLKHALKLRPSIQDPTAAYLPTLVLSITGLVELLHGR
jgi:hypothetical protein